MECFLPRVPCLTFLALTLQSKDHWPESVESLVTENHTGSDAGEMEFIHQASLACVPRFLLHFPYR